MVAEDAFRYMGGGFQILGVVIIILGIERARSYLRGRPSFLERVWSAIEHRARQVSRRVRGEAPQESRGNLGQATEVNEAFPIQPELGVSGLDTRAALDELERRMKALKDHVDARDRGLRNRMDQAREKARSETAASIERLRSEVHHLTVGGSTLQLGGAFLFLLGITFQTWDAELADLLRRMTNLRPPRRFI